MTQIERRAENQERQQRDFGSITLLSGVLADGGRLLMDETPSPA